MTAEAGPDLPEEEVRAETPATGSEPPPADAPAVVDEDGQPADGTGDEVDDLAAHLEALRAELSERTADVQRVQAEYANYRKRVERDREAARQQTVAATLGELLPVLDDIGRAREHGELTGAFKAVGEALEATVARLGLERYGEPGEPFDPSVHEAISHTHSADVTETTCVAVLQPGYRLGDRVVRPARVAVADPDTEGVD